MGEIESRAQQNSPEMVVGSINTINSRGTGYTDDIAMSLLPSMKVSRKDLLKQLTLKIKRSKTFLS